MDTQWLHIYFLHLDMETFYTSQIHGFPEDPTHHSLSTPTNWDGQSGPVALGIILGSSFSLVGLAFAFITYRCVSSFFVVETTGDTKDKWKFKNSVWTPFVCGLWPSCLKVTGGGHSVNPSELVLIPLIRRVDVGGTLFFVYWSREIKNQYH